MIFALPLIVFIRSLIGSLTTAIGDPRLFFINFSIVVHAV